MLVAVASGQTGFEVRAAASAGVPGWQRLLSPGGDPIWVSPTITLTAADVERAETRQSPQTGPAVAVLLTDTGAKKMEALSAGQLNKPIALMLDGKVIWAPIVRGPMGKEALLTGGINGFSPAELQRLLSLFEKR
jgi:preprotein translocase subunit SecD